MREYELKRGWGKKLQGDGLRAAAAGTFGSATLTGGKVVATFGALAKLTAWTDGKTLFVDTEMVTDVPDDVARQTISAFNRFLESATGFGAKERAKRARQSAKATEAEEAAGDEGG
jgi:hypothetical protein